MSTIDEFATDMARIIELAHRWGEFKDARAKAAAEVVAPVIEQTAAKPALITNSGISEVPVKGAQ